jgi:hypothetical protein
MHRIAAAAFLASASACAGDDHHGDDEPVNCATETRDDDFVVGLEKGGRDGLLMFRLMSSTPAPPGRGDNTWEIDIVDAGGAPRAGATVVVTPFMPDHQHGTPIDAVVTESTTIVGRYTATPINLWMPGLWEVTIETTSVPLDRATYKFCIPG